MKLKKIRAWQLAAIAAHRTANTDADRAYWEQQYNAALDAEDKRSLVKSSAWVEDAAQAALEQARMPVQPNLVRDRSSMCADLLRPSSPPEPDRAQTATPAEAVGNQAGYVSNDVLRRLTRQAIDELKAENTLHTQPVVLARVNELLAPKRVGRRRVNPIMADLGKTLPRQRPRNK